jgi:hypothetical protein
MWKFISLQYTLKQAQLTQHAHKDVAPEKIANWPEIQQL